MAIEDDIASLTERVSTLESSLATLTSRFEVVNTAIDVIDQWRDKVDKDQSETTNTFQADGTQMELLQDQIRDLKAQIASLPGASGS